MYGNNLAFDMVCFPVISCFAASSVIADAARERNVVGRSTRRSSRRRAGGVDFPCTQASTSGPARHPAQPASEVRTAVPLRQPSAGGRGSHGAYLVRAGGNELSATTETCVRHRHRGLRALRREAQDDCPHRGAGDPCEDSLAPSAYGTGALQVRAAFGGAGAADAIQTYTAAIRSSSCCVRSVESAFRAATSLATSARLE
jgi:hypothetical protein